MSMIVHHTEGYPQLSGYFCLQRWVEWDKMVAKWDEVGNLIILYRHVENMKIKKVLKNFTKN